ncbi:MAG: polysaccharide biosynthesis tyrosine autokinase [Stigonema ocellatum SAG 48.90 = DSM 106950]|nr:polysaccharide biosynthesis tyrosine autokinase [Stigonema ocellatum SAG 48.90 = DSM 106950]
MPSKQEDQDFVNFQHYGLILKKRWLLIVTVTGFVFGLTGFFTFSQKPVYEAEGKLLFNKHNRASSLTGLNQPVGELSGLTNLSNPLDTEAEVIRSEEIAQKTITDLKLKDNQRKPLEMDGFLRKLKIKSIRGTDVLDLSYRSIDPQEASAVINLLMHNYQENNIRTNRSEATAAREFLSEQLPQVETRVLEAEAALRRFKEEYKIIALDEEAKEGVKRLGELSDQITKTQALLGDVKSRSQALQSQLALNTQQAMELNTLSQSNAVQQILTEYQKVQDQLAVERSRYQKEHPAIINLLSKEKALREQLERRVGQTLASQKSVPEQNLQLGKLKQTLTANLVQSEVERLGLENQVGTFRKAFLLYQGRLRALPRLEQKQLQLERQLQVARGTYEQMLKRLQEVQVVENQNLGNARIISFASVPKKPVSPRIILNLVMGGFFGIFLALGTALILEAIDKSLKTVEEAKQLLGYPLLGTIPVFDQKAQGGSKEGKLELPVLNAPHSSVNAAFEMLQTNLGFTLSDKTLKVIVVSSAVMGEGKSYVAANLAVATAQMGRRVLLVDADMRRPRQQEIWQIPNLMGLSNILVGQIELQTTVKEALVNLELLTAGQIPPNPTALLDSQRMSTLLQKAAEDYDYVIIDTPPISMLADAMILSKQADGVLLVVRPGVVNSAAASFTRALLEQSRSQVLGMVVNGIGTGSSYGYYYSTPDDETERNQMNNRKTTVS